MVDANHLCISFCDMGEKYASLLISGNTPSDWWTVGNVGVKWVSDCGTLVLRQGGGCSIEKHE